MITTQRPSPCRDEKPHVRFCTLFVEKRPHTEAVKRRNTVRSSERNVKHQRAVSRKSIDNSQRTVRKLLLIAILSALAVLLIALL